MGKAYTASGYEGAVRYSAKELEKLYLAREVSEPGWIASWYARIGDNEQALKWVEIAFTDRDGYIPILNLDPSFAALRSDPRYQDLVKRVGLPH
jgi:hypothetical protein